MNRTSDRINLVRAFAVVVMFIRIASAAEQSGIRATLDPETARKPAPKFALQNANGKLVRLEDYHGKVVLLDFWATECGGCVQEIPWFMEMARFYQKPLLR